MAFSGENVLKRRHTANLDIELFVTEIFGQIQEKYQRLDVNIDRLKNQGIGMDEARLTIIRAAESMIINSSDILPVLQEFQEPRHQEFEGATRWNLLNAFTEIGKKFHQPRSQFFHNRLAGMFELNG